MFISYCHKIPFDSILGKSSKSKIMLHVRAAHPTVIYNKAHIIITYILHYSRKKLMAYEDTYNTE